MIINNNMLAFNAAWFAHISNTVQSI